MVVTYISGCFAGTELTRVSGVMGSVGYSGAQTHEQTVAAHDLYMMCVCVETRCHKGVALMRE